MNGIIVLTAFGQYQEHNIILWKEINIETSKAH